MVSTGDEAPDFTVPLADGEITPFTLSSNLTNAPFILAFFPVAFTSVCTTELSKFESDHGEIRDLGATLLGVSVDTPFSLNEFRDKHDFSFGLLSDMDREIIDAYDVRTDFADIGVYGIAKRAVFIVNKDREITYDWVSDDPSLEPDYAGIKDALAKTD